MFVRTNLRVTYNLNRTYGVNQEKEDQQQGKE